eukprot:GFKZ01014613.1.p1 GENE.GFKZ01014613.1~~GFKZ01014613.1.p1  ORF type:complete len:1505 (+),score=256.84 GFKZ01014613.1:186-4700(+)
MATTAGEAAAQAARRAEALRVHETSAMLLSFFNLSFPAALSSSRHPSRRSDNPVNRLLPLLSDGILLADIVALLSPSRLPPSSILRSIPRNALSLPSSNARPVDARQKDVLYNTNTRKVVSVVRKLLDDVRATAVPTLLAPPNAADAYLGDVTGTSPERDIRPALRLAELVVAAAVYGPDGRKYAASFWKLPSDAARMSFHKSMTAVAHAMYLPMPNGIYADREGEGPQPSAARSASEGIVGLERRHDDEVGVAPIATEAAVGVEEGMGGRKISMVTEDEAGSAGASPPRHVEDADVLGSGGGESVSEEFYTPREISLSPRRDADKSLANAEEVFSPMPIGGAVVGAEYVAENVRQSVTTSITKNMSNVQVFEEDDGMGTINTEISSLNLGESGRNNEDVEEPSSVGYDRDNARPVDFCDPSFMMSPSGSDVPAPSNQWQIERQRAAAANVMSPQQLFSPPRMPRRLSRTAAAAQITPPPGPPLFRADSPHLSVSSSAGARSSQEVDNQYLGKAPRVSFAPNIISPGGHQRPLGRSLRAASPEVRKVQQEGSASKDAGFSILPPSAAGGAGPSRIVGLPEQDVREGRESGSSVPGAPPRDPGDDLWEDSGEVVADEQAYGEDDEGEVATDESVSSEKPSLQEVEEFVVVKPTGQGSPRERKVIEDTSGVSAEHSLGVHTKKPHAKSGSSSGDIFDTGSVGGVGSEGVVAGKGNIDGFELDALYDEKAAMEALNYTPGMSPMRTPVPSSPAHYSRSFPREVPPTPPSPPTVAALVESITPRRQTSDAIDARPVSTMEPSAGLFQKLISVWQNAEEEGGTPGQPARARNEISLPIFAPEVPTSYSTQESTLPSGDTDMEFGRPQGQMESPRSRRRRGIRMDSGSPAARDLRRSQAMSDDSGHQDEKGSVASFSDAFSSDKERNWLYGGRTAADGYDWEEAMRGDNNAGIPVSSSQSSQGMHRQADNRKDGSKPVAASKTRPPLPPSPRTSGRRSKHTTSTGPNKGVVHDGQFLKVDRRRLDWLTRELLSARDAISRQELQMTFAETQRLEQEEVLLLDKQNAESVVDAMKKILGEREAELKDARSRLSVAIEGVGGEQRASRSSETSIGGDNVNLKEFISERHTKLHSRMDASDRKRQEADEVMAKETRALWVEVQRALIEKMAEMTEKRDAELEFLRAELARRQKIADDLQKSSADLQSKNDGMQSDMQALRLEKERAAHRYQMEMAHVGAQVELVNEFSKKLHDNFRETENLRQQVLQYQDKLAHITSTSGVSQRQIKELREAVTRANDECARLRREADMAKRAGMEAVRRAEELEELRRDSGGSRNRLPDRQDRSLSGSFHSHEPVRPAGQNRPGGTGTAARYHNATRGRGVAAGPTPAQKAWLVIKDKIGGIVTGKEGNASRRRPTGHSGRREYGRSPSAHSGSRSSSHSRSRRSPREEDIARGMRSPSVKSRSSHGSGSTVRSGPPRSVGSSRRASPALEREYMHDSPKSRGEMRIRAVDF